MSLLFQNRKNMGVDWKYDDVRRVGSMSRGQILPSLNILIPLMNDPLPKFDGFGICTVAGGPYLRYLWAQVHTVREISDAPIWCYYLGDKEVDHPAVEMLLDMNVTFVDAIPLMERENYQSHHGWCAKSIAVMHSPFREVCFLDADAFPLIDPETILDHPDFSTGCLLWPDIQHCRTSNKLFPDLGLTHIPDWREAEAGQFFVDKNKFWKEIQLYSFFNGRPKPFHELAYGDKVLLQLACMKLGRKFNMGGDPTYDGSAITHHLTDGTPAFFHYGNHKRGAEATPEVKKLLMEFDKF